MTIPLQSFLFTHLRFHSRAHFSGLAVPLVSKQPLPQRPINSQLTTHNPKIKSRNRDIPKTQIPRQTGVGVEAVVVVLEVYDFISAAFDGDCDEEMAGEGEEGGVVEFDGVAAAAADSGGISDETDVDESGFALAEAGEGLIRAGVVAAAAAVFESDVALLVEIFGILDCDCDCDCDGDTNNDDDDGASDSADGNTDHPTPVATRFCSAAIALPSGTVTVIVSISIFLAAPVSVPAELLLSPPQRHVLTCVVIGTVKLECMLVP